MTRFRTVSSPVGDLVLAGDEGLTGIRFAEHRGVSPIGTGWSRDATAFGYAGGLATKRWLLAHESALATKLGSPPLRQ